MYLRYLAFSLLVSFLTLFCYIEQVLYIISIPLLSISNMTYFMYTDIQEIFYIYIFLSIFMSFFISLCIFVYYLWFFMKSGLYNYELKFINYFIIIGSLYFALTYIYIEELINIIVTAMYHIYDLNTLFNINLQPKLNEYFLSSTKTIFIINIIMSMLLIYIFIYNKKLIAPMHVKVKRMISIIIIVFTFFYQFNFLFFILVPLLLSLVIESMLLLIFILKIYTTTSTNIAIRDIEYYSYMSNHSYKYTI
jgi:Sec-independent protein secretion pathway component TatC